MAADTQTTPPVDQIVDWEFAARTAARVGRPGPEVSASEAEQIVAQLRDSAAAAHPHVQSVTGLNTVAGEGVLIVDRAGWARANITAFRTLLAPVITEVFEKRDKPPARIASLGSRVAGAEVGGLLGILSSRVLGQYDAFGDPGRLLLVAPTIVAIERDLGVVPADFRLWVCLHEETHRVQFTATDWLAGHLLGEVRGLIGELMQEPSQVTERLVGALRGLPDIIRGDSTGAPLLDALQTPEQRRRLAAITAVMSLLEGHADVVMDDVGPQVVPSVATIRERFSKRRAGRGAVDQLLRRLLGLDAKARQYADGARFVRGVIEQVGMDGFNAVWRSPETLPHPDEIADPRAWVRRVHG
ncbi:MAG TPA: zinc-dependent metalloprotease [Kineosporiaceae bacterium]|nr:zinc-dependent metalloprotease [Kineosporiaceae bacterium]